MSLNKVMLIGNVGMDPEVRYLENQAKVARLRLATTESYTDRNGEKRENTEWHTVTCWRRLADLVEKYVKKGVQIYVEGRLQTREWTDQSGNKRYSTEVSADNIQLLGRRDGAVSGGQGGYGAGNQAANAGAGYGAGNQGANSGYGAGNQGANAGAGYGAGNQGANSGYGAGYGQGPAATNAAQSFGTSNTDFGGADDDDLPF